MSAPAVVALAVAAIGCQRSDQPPAPHALVPADLEAQLATIVGPTAAPADIARAVASWRLDEATFDRTVIPTYRVLYADYVAAFDAAAPAIVAQLARGGAIHARRHFAGDRALVDAQARTRWAVPTMFPSAVADLGGAPLPIVFAPAGDHFGALLGLDDALLARARALDPQCADLLALAGPANSHCSDAGWMIADGALRGDRAAFDHGCQLATALCR